MSGDRFGYGFFWGVIIALSAVTVGVAVIYHVTP